jgi:hypothetical protein
MGLIDVRDKRHRAVAGLRHLFLALSGDDAGLSQMSVLWGEPDLT